MKLSKKQTAIILTILFVTAGVLIIIMMVISSKSSPTTKPPTESAMPLDETTSNSINILESRSGQSGSEIRYQLHVTLSDTYKLTPTSVTLLPKKGGTPISPLSVKLSEIQSSCEHGETEKRNYVKYETPWFTAMGKETAVDSESELTQNYSVELTLTDPTGKKYSAKKEIVEMCFVLVNLQENTSSDDYVPLDDESL